MNFWERVCKISENKQISKKQLAIESGFDVSLISKGVKDGSYPSVDKAVKIAKILDTSVEELLSDIL